MSTRGRRRDANDACSPELARWIALELAPWFLANQRDLSFRRTRDPWAVWVSEIMLQQTRVDTVERHYTGFLRRFPDVGTLAAADEDDVLAAWSGLGYYRRARLLHRGARWVAEHHGGEVPQDPDALRAIPGVGPYTAGAIGSIAFDRPVPLVDGNVARVLSRLAGIHAPAEQAATAPAHWQRVRAVLAHGQPRVLAQALMELGATVCTPRSPRCDVCPLAARCEALATGACDTIPAPRTRKVSPVQHLAAIVVTCRGRRLFVRRPAEGILAGLWCLPLVELETPSAVPAASALARVFDGEVTLGAALEPTVRHVFTHRIWDVRVIEARASRRPSLRDVAADRQAWIEAGRLPEGGIPTLLRKLVARVP